MAFVYHESKKISFRVPRIQDPDDLIANGNQQTLCSVRPLTYTEAHVTYMLAAVALAGGDYTKDAGQKKLIVAAKSGVAMVKGGLATYVAIIDTVQSILKVVSRCTPLSVTAPGTVDIPAWNCFY